MMSETNRFVLAYDLPCEHRKIFARDQAVQKTVQRTRWDCTYMLHNLGLQCTQSVILVGPSQEQNVDRVLLYVQESYRRLQERLNASGYAAELTPDLEKIQIHTEQVPQFVRLASTALNRKVDAAIQHLSDLIDTIPQLNRRQTHSLRYRIPREVREWNSIAEMAEQYGIDTRNVRYLLSLFEEAHNRVVA